jgi:hypothetical protein
VNKKLVLCDIIATAAWLSKDACWHNEWRGGAYVAALIAISALGTSVFLAGNAVLRWGSATAFFWLSANFQWMSQDWAQLAWCRALPNALFIVAAGCFLVTLLVAGENRQALAGVFGRVRRP